MSVKSMKSVVLMKSVTPSKSVSSTKPVAGRRTYTSQFKREAVELVEREGGAGASQARLELQARPDDNLGSAQQPEKGGEAPRFATADQLPQDQAQVVGGSGD